MKRSGTNLAVSLCDLKVKPTTSPLAQTYALLPCSCAVAVPQNSNRPQKTPQSSHSALHPISSMELLHTKARSRRRRRRCSLAVFATAVLSVSVTTQLLKTDLHDPMVPAAVPNPIRRGLIRVYITLLIPWTVWFGHMAYKANASIISDFSQGASFGSCRRHSTSPQLLRVPDQTHVVTWGRWLLFGMPRQTMKFVSTSTKLWSGTVTALLPRSMHCWRA